MASDHKYSIHEKLKSKKSIELLFNKGKSINDSPIRVIYLHKTALENVPVKMGVTVSKKNIRLAVNRNLIKRRIREAYRTNNTELKHGIKKTNSELILMFIYNSKQILPYKEIESKIKVLLARLIELSEAVGE